MVGIHIIFCGIQLNYFHLESNNDNLLTILFPEFILRLKNVLSSALSFP